MNSIQLARFRDRLNVVLLALDHDGSLGQTSQKTVTLDQQSVGRLSRMDAMQQQAMAKANQARQGQMRQRIQAALARMDLVTREEFDVQSAVLARTREKLQHLEARVAELERQAAADAAGDA